MVPDLTEDLLNRATLRIRSAKTWQKRTNSAGNRHLPNRQTMRYGLRPA